LAIHWEIIVNKVSFIKLSVLAAMLTFNGCFEEESLDSLPSPEAKKPAPLPVAEPSIDEPELQPIEQITDMGSDQAESAPATFGDAQSLQKGSGFYVVQVGLRRTNSQAKKFIAKLQESGIKAYSAKVENPGEEDGTFYRIRIGYFSKIAEARQFGEEVLQPLGYAYWVDNKSNDHQGNPGGSYESYSNDYSYEANEPATPAADQWASEPTPTPAAPAADSWESAPAATEPEPAPAADSWESVPAATEPEPAPAADDWSAAAPTEPAPKLDTKPTAPVINTENGMAAQQAAPQDDWSEAPAASDDDWSTTTNTAPAAATNGDDGWSTGGDEWQ
jgi:hypothetical protein